MAHADEFTGMSRYGSHFVHACVYICAVTILTACTAVPMKTQDLRIDNPYGIVLPIKGQVLVDIAPRERQKTLTVRGGFYTWTLNEGELIQSAALKVFGRVFDTVASGDDTSRGSVLIRVSGHGRVDELSAAYSVDAAASVVAEAGTQVGRFQASGAASSGKINDPIALENAYLDAFSQIAGQILKNEKFVLLVKNGLGRPRR